MSFAQLVKEELCTVKRDNHCNSAELESLIRLAGEIVKSNNKIVINFSSINAVISRRFFSLVKKFYSCDIEIFQKQIKKLNQNFRYIVSITSMAEAIIEEYQLYSSTSSQKEDIQSRRCCMEAYLRGAFLAKGSVNDPKSARYHLEIAISNENEAIFVQKIMNEFDLNAKMIRRRNDLVIYLKDVQAIKDFLRIIGASKTVFMLEDIVLKRNFASDINRILNCDIANEMKTLDAAKDQLRYIKYLEYNYPLDKLDPKILMVMKVRKDYPEATFNELIVVLKEQYDVVITKSGLNHRFRKIKEIAIDYSNKKGEK